MEIYKSISIMKDKNPIVNALKGPDPQPGYWADIVSPTSYEERRIYPGEGKILSEDIQDSNGINMTYGFIFLKDGSFQLSTKPHLV